MARGDELLRGQDRRRSDADARRDPPNHRESRADDRCHIGEDRRADNRGVAVAAASLGVLFAAFSILALVLAAVGIYGVISYTVAQRAREIGVRLALGATPADVLRLVVGEGMMLCAIGAALGALCAAATGQVVSSLLFGVTPYDGRTYALVLGLMGITSLAACCVPADRAARINPAASLQGE
jgi:ABC-type antimicrobial peptide transport system permease subunit